MKLPKCNELFSENQIRAKVNELGVKIKAEFNDGKPIVCVCVLRGAVMFFADLMKAIDSEQVVYDFITLQSYETAMVQSESMQTTGKVRLVQDLRTDVSDKHVLVVEDIVDSGKTLSHLVRYLKERGAASVKTCTLLDKPDRRAVDFTPDYCGKIIPDEFVVGFGLDYDEKYRNLPFIGVLKPEIYTQ